MSFVELGRHHGADDGAPQYVKLVQADARAAPVLEQLLEQVG